MPFQGFQEAWQQGKILVEATGLAMIRQMMACVADCA
jgi:hypothetical protein